MQQFLMILAVFNQLFPLVNQFVGIAEQAFPQGGMGQQKLEMVRSTLEAAFKTYQGVTVTFEQVWPLLQPAIAGIVALAKLRDAKATS